MNTPDTPQSPLFEVSADSFQTDVVERSQQIPVILLFWAQQVPPSADALRELQELLPQYQGKVVVGTVDVAADQTLAQHLRVQGLPSIRVVNGGQITEQLDGPQPQAALKELLDNLTLSSTDMLKDQLQQVLDAKDFATAATILQQSVNEEPNNMAFRVELADVLVRQGNVADAQSVLATIKDDTAELGRPQTRLALLEIAATLPPVADLEAQRAANSDDLESLYGLAIHAAVAEDFDLALEACMTIVQTDRKFRDDIGRVALLQLFEVLGKADPRASAFRRRLFAFLH